MRERFRWWLAWVLTEVGFKVLGFSDTLAAGEYNEDMSCRRWYAEATWRVGNWFYGKGNDLYGKLLP